ncbi:MAG: CDP-glycerol glycerophosphotransferase family protein [Lachnospiraceae bacterium]|nr:CDP-glycerol glycerophosphotransferase family protein [Lachnospiraceae bacterium]
MHLYIDPGTGSMLFTILIGAISSLVFFGRKLFLKLSFVLHGGKAAKGAGNEDRIPIAIFSDHKRYWNVFCPVCDELEKRGVRAEYMTASPDDPALEQTYEYVKTRFIGEGNAAFARLNMLRADVILSTTPGLDVYQWKRSKYGGFYVHVLHAANDPIAYRMFGLDYYDAILLSGSYQTAQIRSLEEKRGLPAKELVLAGLPHMDLLASQLTAAGKDTHEGVNVLLAPSWGINGIFSVYGASIVEALLATDCHIILRPHPQSLQSEKEMIDALKAQFPDSDRLEWNTDNDNFEVLRRSDILISDFSGVIFDFTLVFDKPVIYADTSFDTGPLDAWWLGEDALWTFRALPRIGHALVKEDLPRIGEVISHCLTDESFARARAEVRDETWVHRGESAALIAEYLIDKQHSLTAEDAGSMPDGTPSPQAG